jgi:hypothetical protein
MTHTLDTPAPADTMRAAVVTEFGARMLPHPLGDVV